MNLDWLLAWSKCKADNLQPGNVVLFFDHFPSAKEVAERIMSECGRAPTREEFDNMRICVTRPIDRQ